MIFRITLIATFIGLLFSSSLTAKAQDTVDQAIDNFGLGHLNAKDKQRVRSFGRYSYELGVTSLNQAPKTRASSCPITGAVKSRLAGDFEGFEGETVFELQNGQIWKQSEYHYEYHYAFSPKLLIFKDRGRWFAQIEGMEKPVGVTCLA